MFSKFRSLIFKIDPEIAHNLAIKSLKLNLTPNLRDENKDDPMFETKLFGKVIDNPIGMAAGFDKNAEVYNSLFKLGFVPHIISLAFFLLVFLLALCPVIV